MPIYHLLIQQFHDYDHLPFTCSILVFATLLSVDNLDYSNSYYSHLPELNNKFFINVAAPSSPPDEEEDLSPYILVDITLGSNSITILHIENRYRYRYR